MLNINPRARAFISRAAIFVSAVALIECGGSSTAPTVASSAVSGVTLSATSVTAGGSGQGTVSLTAAALTGGATISLSSSNPAVATVQTTVTIPDDASIQSQIEKILASDPVLSQLDVSTLVESGKVTVVGSVHSPDMKQRVERAVRSVKGVSSVDNQLVVTQATP